tara:strand:+ start:537 stop:695 length:159 start_codon:yes stop_codon:yes gene_type:complete
MHCASGRIYDGKRTIIGNSNMKLNTLRHVDVVVVVVVVIVGCVVTGIIGCIG